jgi:hypothetical protein
MTENDLAAKLLEKEKQVHKLALMIKDNKEKLKELTELNNKKDEEIRQYIEKLKTLERRNDDAYKNVATNNISDINEIKNSNEKEKLVLNELIKTLKNNLNEKNQDVQKSREDINELRLLLEEERKKNDTITTINLAKFDAKSIEVQFYKLSTENSSLRTKLANAEEKLEKILEQNEKLKAEKLENEKINKQNSDLINSELSTKNGSLKTLLKDYYNTTKTLNLNLDDLNKAKFFNRKYEDDIASLQKKLRSQENELVDLRVENESMRTRIKGNDAELENTRRKLKEYENKISEIRLSKQVFDVTYYYMNSVSMVGKFIMMREGEKFVFIIENRTSSRKLSFVDIDLRRDLKDPAKLYVRFVKDNTEEEYYSGELNKIFEYFEDFRKKSIELSTETEMRSKQESKENEKKVNAKLKDIFKI